MIGGLVLAGLLQPAAWGVWKYVQLVMGYTAYSNFGTTNGLDRSCPALVTKGKLGLYRRFLGSSLAFSTLVSAPIALVFLILGIVSDDPLWKPGFLALAPLVLLQPSYQHGEAALSSEKRFGAKARAIIASTVFRITLSLAAAWFFGLAGVLAVFILTLGLTAWYMYSATAFGSPLPAFRNLAGRIPAGLVRLGLPITLLAFAEQIWLTADKWLVGGIFDANESGLYLFAAFPLPLLLMVPSALRQIVSIDVYDKYTRTRQLGPCREIYERSVMAIALLSPVTIGAVYLGMPWIVDLALKKYAPAIPLLQLHALLSYPVLVSQMALPILVVTRRVRATVLGYLAACAVATAASAWRLGASTQLSMMLPLAIAGACWGVFAVALLATVFVWMGDSVPWAAWRVLRWMLPMAYIAVELPALSWLLEHAGLRPHSTAFAFTGGALHLLACAPFLWMLEKRIRGLSFLLARFRRRAAA